MILSRTTRLLVVVLNIFFVMYSATVFGEKVYKFQYNDLPEPLNGKTISVMDKSVALDKYILAGDAADSGNVLGVVSVMFIVDHTGSMGQAWTDAVGQRWTVCNTLADLIYQKSPNSEIGFSIFGSDLYFNLNDESLFIPCTGSNGGVLPPLKLNDTYTSKAFGTGTGYALLKKFLTHQENTNSISWLATHPNPNTSIHLETNINIAMVSAKAGLEKSRYPKGNRFIILITDGDATVGGSNYVQGIETPTTFTFFIGTVPQNITTMTKNIHDNGYSSSNTLTRALSLTSSNLANTAVNTIMPNIFQRMRLVPNKMTVNGSIISTNWDKKGFIFPELFPLTAQNTPFEYIINCKLYKDSGTTNSIFIKDTIVNINYTAKIDPGPSTPKVDHYWWDRTFKFYKAGAEITTITDPSGDIECRFYVDSGTAKYQYAKVDLSVTNKATNPLDKESFSTTKQGNYFTTTIKHAVTAVTPGDNILQHIGADSMIVTFKNPALPLDTLRAAIPFQILTNVVTLSRSTYFDLNADGLVDSIAVEFSGSSIKAYSAPILQKLKLPGWRLFTVGTPTAFDNAIGLRVTQGLNQPITAVTKDDTIKISDTVTMTADFKLASGAVWVIDKVAPVVVKASLVDSIKPGARDELTVELSEDVKTITVLQPYLYYDIAGKKGYFADLTPISQSGKIGVFSVGALTGATRINDGDSIWINAGAGVTTKVSDNLNNEQGNPANIKRPISVRIVDDFVRMDKALLFDNNADGLVDSVFLSIPSPQVQNNVAGVMAKIVFPAARILEAITPSYTTGGIGVTVREKSGVVKTYVTADDKISLSDTVALTTGIKMAPGTVDCIDKMAPVIMKASFIDSVKPTDRDELTVVLSEPVAAITESSPFGYKYTPTNAHYTGNLNVLSVVQATGLFAVLSTTSTALTIKDGDSIQISAIITNKIADNQGNNQANDNNIYRRIDVTMVEEGIVMKRAAYFDNDANGNIDSMFIEIAGDRIKDHVADFIKALKLPLYRNLTITNAASSTGGIALTISETLDPVQTAVTNADKAVIVDKVDLPDKISILPVTIQIEDKMAPVIKKGGASAIQYFHYIKKGKNLILPPRWNAEVKIAFSENIMNITPDKPFGFFSSIDKKTYQVTLQKTGQTNDSAVFTVTAIDSGRSFKNGDSVRISALVNNVSDTLTNNQGNPDNIRRLLSVTTFCDTVFERANYKLVLKATQLDLNPQKTIGLGYLKDMANKTVPHNLKQGEVDRYFGIMILTLTPNNKDSLSDADWFKATVNLYDPLGNIVIESKQFEDDKDSSRAVYFWNGLNRSNRSVSAGQYLAIVKVDYLLNNAVQGKEIFRQMVGVLKTTDK